MTTQRRTVLLVAVSVALAVPACVERSRDLTAAEREQLRPFILTEEPTPQHRLDVSFEDKIRLLGYDLSPDTATPGGTINVTWYWKCDRALEEGWALFTHMQDAAGADRQNADGEGVIRRLYPPGRWKAGEYIKDVQAITLDQDWNSNRLTVFVGLWNGPHRLQITRGPNDGDNRVRAFSIPVTGAGAAAQPEGAARPPVPTIPALRAPKISTPITVDGNLDEPAWRVATSTTTFVNTMTGENADFLARAKVAWDDNNLYVGFDVRDDFLKSDYTERDDHLWEQDAVEIMVDPGGHGQNYFEMQVSPQGVVFDTRYDSRRVPAPIGHADWDSGLHAAVTRRGTANDDEDDQGYTVEIAIPWSAFHTGEPAYDKPNNGDTWRLNFYVMDKRRDGGQRAAAWSPPRVGDFHMPTRFGRVTFVDPAAAGVAPPTPGKAPELHLPPNLVKQLRGMGGQGLQDQQNRDRPRPGEEVPAPPP